MKRICGIYKIENCVSHKVYVGQSNDVRRRWKAHIRALSDGNHENEYLQRAWNKDGQDAFSFSVLETCETREQLNDKEAFWANEYTGGSYNLGAIGNVVPPAASVREKLSSAHLGKSLSADHRSRISAGMRGRRRSEEEKERMRRSGACAKAVFCVELGEGFFSLAEAERRLGISKAGICRALKDPGKTAGKREGVRLHWRYE